MTRFHLYDNGLNLKAAKKKIADAWANSGDPTRAAQNIKCLFEDIYNKLEAIAEHTNETRDRLEAHLDSLNRAAQEERDIDHSRDA